MKVSRPSPSMAVSLTALVVAMAGTATAATVVITNSSQVKTGAINGSDVKNRSLTGIDLADGVVNTRQLATGVRSALTGQGFVATEAVRKKGPDLLTAGEHKIATLSQLQPGTYAIFAKTTIAPDAPDQGLLDALLKQVKTASGLCRLDAAGDQDVSQGNVISPGTAIPLSVEMQLTRTISTPGDVTVSCDVNNTTWRAADTSIIALKLAGSSRTDVTG